MNSKHLQGKIGGALLAFSLLFGIALASSTTAQAQYRDRDGQYRRDRDGDSRRERDRDDNYRRNRDYRNDPYGRNGGYGNNGGYGTYGGYNNIYRVAQDQGYQAGLNVGASDANRGQSYNPQRSHYYKDGTDGYNSSYGNKGQYKQVYRDAFLRGYDEGYRRYGYNNNGGYRRRSNAGSVLGNILGLPY